ncbi:rhotekin-2-like [Oscarella lobularis]|uniref:rhotekin-2-like n=1 Tax=Oscarella lobularis TaxID=121494 RepID=UPI0033137751
MEPRRVVWSPRKRRAAATATDTPNASGSRSNEGKRSRMGHETPQREKTAAEMDIEREIEHEYRIRDGATKLLRASKNVRQSMESAKSLLTSNARVLSLMAKLQRTRADTMIAEQTGEERSGSGAFEPCKAKLIISDIRIPLEVKGVKATQKTGSDPTYCTVFCLFKLDGQIKETEGLVDVTKNTTDITFPDAISFSDVSHNFKLHIELYCSPMDKKGNKKSLADVTSSPAQSDPKFTIVGHSHLRLDDVSDTVQTHTITAGVVGASPSASCNSSYVPLTSQLSLWGQFCCLLRVQPNCATGTRLTGFTNVQRMISELPAWTRYWCVLRQNYIRCWVSPEDIGRKTAVHSIKITEDTSISNAPRLTMRRHNTLLLAAAQSGDEHFISLESKEEKSQWQDALNQTIVDIKTWKDWCSRVTPVHPIESWRRAHSSPSIVAVSPAPKVHMKIVERTLVEKLSPDVVDAYVEMAPLPLPESIPMKKRRAPSPPPPKSSLSGSEENKVPSSGSDSDSPRSTPPSVKKRRAPAPPVDQIPFDGKTRESTAHYYTAL